MFFIFFYVGRYVRPSAHGRTEKIWSLARNKKRGGGNVKLRLTRLSKTDEKEPGRKNEFIASKNKSTRRRAAQKRTAGTRHLLLYTEDAEKGSREKCEKKNNKLKAAWALVPNTNIGLRGLEKIETRTVDRQKYVMLCNN